VLDRLAGATALIIDVRMNGGVDDRLAFDVAGRFLSQVRSAGTVRYRNGPQQTDLGDGWQFTVSRRLHLQQDGTPVEGRGIPPEVHSAWDAGAAQSGRDVVLEAAFAQVRAGR
jgi:C-terminal processing protease CtpA/Prc